MISYSYSKSRLQINKITFGALFASISIILKLFVNIETNEFRMSIFEVPIILSGVLLGPIFGGIVGLISDLVYSMVNFRGLNVGINLFTLSSILYGLIPGLIFYVIRYNKINLSFTIILTMIITFIFNTLQLYIWYENGIYPLLPARLLVLFVKIPLNIIFIHLLVYNKGFLIFDIYKHFFSKHKYNLIE